MRINSSLIVTICFAFASICFSQSAFADDGKITIGSKAPALDIEHWLSDRDGKFAHTTNLEKGKVYVIEFWATWCGPCIGAMPQISQLQDDFADQGVQIISVSDESLDDVEGFLNRKVRGQEELTYAELTSNYCLTTDPDGSVFKQYFLAAGQSGIPCAFIVGKSGLIEWIGHPVEMEDVLPKVIDEDWNREAFLVKFEKERAEAEKRELVQRKLMVAVRKIENQMDEGNFPRAVEMIDELIMDEDLEMLKSNLQSMKNEIVILHMGGDEGVAALKQFIKTNSKNPQALNTIAWGIYEKNKKDGDVDKSILKVAVEASELAVKAVPNNGAVLDTLAHLLYVNGELDRALEVQEKAMKNANGMEAELEPFLKELKKAKAERDK